MQKDSAISQIKNSLLARNFEPELFDSMGKPTADDENAVVVKFDFRPGDTDYGTVVLVIDQDRALEIYFGDNVGKSMDSDDKKAWYDFLEQMRMLAKRNLMNFEIKNINRLKYTMQGMAAIKEGLFEGYYGTKKVSYSDQPKRTKLVIKHNKTLGENDARFRYIESLFVETDQGERFKLPFTKLAGGRAMARHCAEGGNPYDTFGQHISQIVNELNVLSRFIRAGKNKKFSDRAADMAQAADQHYAQLKNKIKKMSGRRGYLEEKQKFDPSEITETEQTVDEIRSWFVEQTLDTRIEEALPLLAKIKETDMREISEFENWADTVSEGTWAMPDDRTAMKKLQQLMAQELIVGPDANNATEQLYDLFGDDELFDRLEDLALVNPDADARPVIQNRAKELGIDLSMPAQPAPVTEAANQYEPVKASSDRLPQEGDIHEIPGALNTDMLPGIRNLRLEKDDYSDTMYFRDPMSNGVFAVYFHGRIPRVRGTDGMNEQRVAEIAQSLARRTAQEDIDTDGIMMTKPSNMSSESAEPSALNRLIELAKV